jgi:hypothetical protein
MCRLPFGRPQIFRNRGPQIFRNHQQRSARQVDGPGIVARAVVDAPFIRRKIRPRTEAEQRAESEARKWYQAEDDARGLAWLRQHFGSTGGPFDPTFDVPLAAGGVIALLTRADLSTQAGADRFLHTHSTSDGSRPSLEQLRTAQAICRALNVSIMSGGNAANWELVRRAHGALDAAMAKRRDVVAILADLRAYQERYDPWRARHPNHQELPGMGIEVRTRRALESLARLDSRFASVDASDLAALVRDPRLAPLGISAKLSLACGAFGDARGPHEGEPKAFRRVKRNYEKAVKEVPT